MCLLFPARCLVCRELTGPGMLLCAACRKEQPERPLERRFSLPGSGASGFRALAPMPYRGGFRKTLYRFKFGGAKGLAKPLGRLMAQSAAGFETGFDAVAWVPMTAKKRRRRGYDQSGMLAKAVAGALGIPCRPLLEKIRETDVQHELPRNERGKNVRGAYRAGPGAAGKNILLVDDIVTTGATLKECASALYRAGAKTVCGLCAADAELEYQNRERGEKP